MVTKNKTSEKEETKGRVNLDKLELNKETVKDLTDSEAKQIQGGRVITVGGTVSPPPRTLFNCTAINCFTTVQLPTG